jgi:hypothetical protein
MGASSARPGDVSGQSPASVRPFEPGPGAIRIRSRRRRAGGRPRTPGAPTVDGIGDSGYLPTDQRPGPEVLGMAFDPAVTSFVLVGVVGGLAIFLNASSDWEVARELARETDGWTAPLLVRRYRTDAAARRRAWREAGVLRGHGYTSDDPPDGTGDRPPAGAGEADIGGASPRTGDGATILVSYFRG